MLSFKSYAKVNIFLKIIGKRDNYHEILSRFVLCENLYDEMTFVKKEKEKEDFELIGDFDCTLEQNTIYKAYKYLKEYTEDKKIDEFFTKYSLRVKKNIPSGGGLGGGSSNAATLLLALYKTLELKIDLRDLLIIGKKIGADVNFFLYETKSANVSGIGEIVEPFDDDIPNLEFIFPDVHSNTALIYKTFRENCWGQIDTKMAKEMKSLSSHELLKMFKPKELNDLLNPLLICYESLKPFATEEQFLSGSGSTFFKVKK
ncbi:MAG: 4-(cytidine 5'-diphospho)-2-C-methyl-D-erythritol kinase [Campylobacteraceae bacterium]